MTNTIKYSRIWSMPNNKTFSIRPIRELINRYYRDDIISIDPFANSSSIARITNDIDNHYNTTYHLDALDFLKIFEDKSVDLCLYDPPYSPRQVSECYRKLGKTVNSETTQSSYWSRHKIELGRIIKSNGIVISFGWNSGGIGLKHGFDIVEILLVPHGGHHNDTICVVEIKK